jgi:tape measure domain-containing protein
LAEYNLGTARGRIELDASQVGSSTQAARQQIDQLTRDLENSSGAFRQLAGGLADLGDSIVGKLTTVAKVGAAAIGGLVAASLWGGLNRVLDTEDARVQMERMGVATEDVNKILEEVDKTFTGTPFANPDGFDISTQLYASGRALDDIPGYLGSIADFAAHANVDISRMGDMFVRIASQGRVTGQELMSLAQMGVPLATLADALGMSVSEMRDMTSAGEFTADMFLEMAGNVEMFQGAAQAMGTTTRGAFANVRTALRVLGDKFLSPLFGQNGYAVQALQAIREGLRSLFPAAEQAGEAFGKWLIPAIERFIHWMKTGFVPGVQAAVEFLKDAARWYKENEETIKKFLSAAGPAAVILGGIATALSLVRKAFMLLKTAGPLGLIYLLVTALVYAWQNSETFRNIVTGAFNAIKSAIQPVIDLVSHLWAVFSEGEGIVDGIIGVIGSLFGAGTQNTVFGFVDKISHLWAIFSEGEGIIDGIIGVIGSLFGADVQNVFFNLLELHRETWANIQEAVNSVVEWFQEHVGPIFTEIGELISAVWERVSEVTSTQWEIISTVVGVALAAIRAIWDRIGAPTIQAMRMMWAQMRDHIMMVWGIIRSVIETVLGVIRGIIQVVTGLIRGDWSKVWQGISTIFISLWRGMSNILFSIINYMAQTISRVVNTIRTIWTNAWNGVRNNAVGAWNGIRNAVIGAITTLLNRIRGIPGDILRALGNLHSLLFNSGKNIIQGLINGINAMIQRVKNAVSGVMSAARNLLPFSPAKEGPFSGRGWTLHSGRSIIEALAKGIEDEKDAAIKAALGVANTVADVFTRDDISLALASSLPSSTGYRSAASSSISNITQTGPSQAVTIEKIEALDPTEAAHIADSELGWAFRTMAR